MRSAFHKRNRSANRTLNRRLNRCSTTMLGGARRPLPPNYLSDALTAFRRAIRAHRQLMKLAPERFDHGVVEHNRVQREQGRARWQKFHAALLKVYGDEANRFAEPPVTQPVPIRSRRTERAIEREMERWQLWLQVGHEAMQQFEQHHQSSRLTLTTICRLLETAMMLGRLSTGRETNWKEKENELGAAWDFEAAIEKIYGSGAS